MAKKKTSSSEFKDLKALKAMDRSDLTAELTDARKALFVLTMKKDLGELKQTHLMRAHRKYIAQISTFLSTAA